MLPDRVSNPGPLTYESGALRIALRGPAMHHGKPKTMFSCISSKRQASNINNTLKCLSIGTYKTINFPFVPNVKLMVIRCPNIQEHYSSFTQDNTVADAILCMKISTVKLI